MADRANILAPLPKRPLVRNRRINSGELDTTNYERPHSVWRIQDLRCTRCAAKRLIWTLLDWFPDPSDGGRRTELFQSARTFWS